MLSAYFANDSASVICVFPDVSENFVLYCPPDIVHRAFSMMTLVIAPCHFVLPIYSGNQIKNILEAKLGCASVTSNMSFNNLNSFVQFFDHLHGAGVCCNTLVICCIRINRDVLADYFSAVSTKIATSYEYWKYIMPKVGTLDFSLIFVAIVLAIVNMNKHLFSSRLSFCYCKTCFVHV